MLISLAACGGNGGSGAKPSTVTEVPDFIYTADYKQLSSGDSNDSIYPSLFTDDGFYYIKSIVVGQDIPDGAVIEWEGQYDVYEDQLYFMGYDGSEKQLTGYAKLEPEEKLEGHEYYTYISTLLLNDGALWCVSELSDSWSDAPEGTEMYTDEWYTYYNYSEEFYLCKLDENGAVESKVLLDTGSDDPNNSVYYSFYNSVMDAEGRLIAFTDYSVIVFDKDGSRLYTIDNNNQDWIDGLVALKDGRILVRTYSNSYELRLIDFDSKSIKPLIELTMYPEQIFAGGGEYPLYYTNGINFYGLDLESGVSTKLFSWISCDVDNNNLCGYTVMDDGSIFGLLNIWNSDYTKCSVESVTLTKKPYDPTNAKKTLTLATQYLDWNVRSEIINFNRSNPDYRIEVLDYSEYNTDEDYSAGLTKLTTEMLAGSLPDIIDLNGLPTQQLAAKGLLEDLYTYIDKDSELSRDDFFPNVLSALEYGGKLVASCSSFYIQTLCGASSVVGDKPGWTLADLKSALAKMPEGCEILSYYTTRDEIMANLVGQTIDRFVNWSTGECSFDSQEFIDILEFAAQFPEEFDWENYNYDSADDDFARITQGRQLLMSGYISSFQDMEYYNAAFGGNMTFIGYPTSSGNGAIMGLQSGYAISSTCSEKDAAWQFVRTFFTEDYQEGNNVYNYPSNINAFNVKLEEAMTPEYEKDINGNYILDDNGEKIEVSHGGMGMADGTIVNFYALTQDMADKLVELINGTTVVMSYNDKIMELVSAETDAYFSGQKSAQDVAKLVQNKVSLYVSEQS